MENQTSCDTEAKVTALLDGAGFAAIKTWTRAVMHHWRPLDHFEYQQHYAWRDEIESLPRPARDDCLSRVRNRLTGVDGGGYVYRGKVVVATAARPHNGVNRSVRGRDG